MEVEQLGVAFASDSGDALVQSCDRRVGSGVAVVPRQHVRDGHLQAALLALGYRGVQFLNRGTSGRDGVVRAATQGLGDVVDPALHDQGAGAVGAVNEARRNLIRALTEDAAVADLELGILDLGPVAELAALVVAEPELPAPLEVGVIKRRAGDDRVAERSDELRVRIRCLRRGRAALVAPAAGKQDRRRQQGRCPQVNIPPNWPPVTFRVWP